MKKISVLLLALFLCSSPLYASVSGVRLNQSTASTLAVNLTGTTATLQPTDINFVGASFYWDGSVLSIDESSAAITSGAINGTTIGATQPANLNYLRPVVTISSSSSTLASVGAYTGNNSIVTTTNSGTIFNVTTPLGTPATVVVSLPGTYQTLAGSLTGLTYTFVNSSTASTLKVRTASSTDATILFGAVQTPGVTAVTSSASTGTTITIVGSGSTWIIASMNGGSNSVNSWTSSTF